MPLLIPPFYAGLFIVALNIWPIFLWEQSPTLACVAFAVNSGLFLFVWFACSSRELSHWTGLNLISASLMSGCANITLLYLPIVLAIVYLITVGYALVGIVTGLDSSRLRWANLVAWFIGLR